MDKKSIRGFVYFLI